MGDINRIGGFVHDFSCFIIIEQAEIVNRM